MAASLYYYEEDEGDGSFHQFHACQVQLMRSRREAPPCWVVHNSPSMIDPFWQTTQYLKSFEEQCEEDEPICWLLICPLTDGGDVAALGLAQWLMATWRWATTISASLICLPAPTVMNIGQFLKEDTTRHGWSMQQWLEAYTHGLQHIRKAVEGRHWRPEGKGFTPKVLPPVEAFISKTGAQDIKGGTIDYWSEPLKNILHQRNEGACANIISYLDELATSQPSRKAWNKLVWPPVSSVPSMPHQAEHLSYIQGHLVELGPTIPPSWFHVSNQNGGFTCFA